MSSSLGASAGPGAAGEASRPSPGDAAPIYPDLNGCNVLITGGAAGIGAAVCLAFVRQGARVISLDRDEEGHRLLGDRCAGAPGSLRGLRVVIANAGYDPRFEALNMAEADWNNLFQLNVTHAFLTCRELLPLLVANGGDSVILTTSHTAWIAKPDLIAYNSSKAVQVGLTRSLAEAYGAQGVRVNAAGFSVISAMARSRRLPRGWAVMALSCMSLSANRMPGPCGAFMPPMGCGSCR